MTTTIDLEAVKQRQQATWASGDFAEIATLIVPVAERLADAADRAGALRRPRRGDGERKRRDRRSAPGLSRGGDRLRPRPARAGTGTRRGGAPHDRLRRRGRRGDPVRRRLVRRRCLGLRVDVRARPPPHRGRDPPRDPPRRRGSSASWTEGSGRPVRTVADHVPPPAGVQSPMLWGTEQHLLDLFGDEVAWKHRRRTFTFRFTSSRGVRRHVRPLLRADAGGRGRRARARRGPAGARATVERLPEGGPIAVPGEYLESVGTRR